jgi:hypothetical protein
MEFKRIDFLRLTDNQKEKLLSGKYIGEGDLTEEQWNQLIMLVGEYANGQDFEECLKRDAKEFSEWLQEVWN